MFSCRVSWKIMVAGCLVLALLASLSGPLAAQNSDVEGLPLADYGPYGVGRMNMTFVDESRGERDLAVAVWYPAVIPEGESARATGVLDASPDVDDAPYPLILYSHGYGGDASQMTSYGNFAGHAVSHGFVLVALNHRDAARMWPGYAGRPLDVQFVLEQLSQLTDGELAGIIDTDRTGIMGYSFGGYTAIAMAGARVDPPALAAWCAIQSDETIRYDPCQVISEWDAFAESIASANLDADAIWPSFTDERIHAVVAMVPWGGPVFGEAGLAAASVPTLFMGATRDIDAPYERDAVFMYTNLGSEERHLLSFVGDDHLFIGRAQNTRPAFHFIMAFFGYHLQGEEDYARYLTPEFVEQVDHLAWGVYEGE